MKLIEERGNLFDLDEKYELAHCISLDCAMGAGIAIEFDRRFNGLKSILLNAIASNEFNYPITISVPDQLINPFGNRVIHNLITKEKYWHKPTYKTITKCINDLVLNCKMYNTTHLAMPKIGCGFDKLQWSKVKNIILEEFGDLDIEIVVRYL